MVLKGFIKGFNGLAFGCQYFPSSLEDLFKSSEVHLVIDLKIIDNFSGILFMNPMLTEDHIEGVAFDLVQSCISASFLTNLIHVSLADCLANDFVNFLLLDSLHSHITIIFLSGLSLSLSCILSKCLIVRDLVESLVSCSYNCLREDIDKVVFLNHI